MHVDFAQLIALGLGTTALHWLIARAYILRWFWSRAHGMLARLLACAACSGFWLGLGLGAAGLRPVQAHPAIAILAAGVLGVVLTPIFEAVMLWGLDRSAIETAETAETWPAADETSTSTDDATGEATLPSQHPGANP